MSQFDLQEKWRYLREIFGGQACCRQDLEVQGIVRLAIDEILITE